jgi:hypothetical protein
MQIASLAPHIFFLLVSRLNIESIEMYFHTAGTWYCTGILITHHSIWSSILCLSEAEQMFIGKHKVRTKGKVWADILPRRGKEHQFVNRFSPQPCLPVCCLLPEASDIFLLQHCADSGSAITASLLSSHSPKGDYNLRLGAKFR